MQGKGGGPKTARGKRSSSKNATKHGVSSLAPIVEGIEKPEEWFYHLDGMKESLQPEGWHESVLVERIALLLWRSRRAVMYELAEIAAGQASAEEDMRLAAAYGRGTLDRDLRAGTLPEVGADVVLGARYRRLLPGSSSLTLLMKYEASIHRQYIQTLHELEAIQARRRGERVHLARLDISSPPSG